MLGSEDIELQASIVMPLQRVMRYVLLLKSLDECTKDEHTDKADIQTAIELALTLATQVNEGKGYTSEIIFLKGLE